MRNEEKVQETMESLGIPEISFSGDYKSSSMKPKGQSEFLASIDAVLQDWQIAQQQTLLIAENELRLISKKAGMPAPVDSHEVSETLKELRIPSIEIEKA